MLLPKPKALLVCRGAVRPAGTRDTGAGKELDSGRLLGQQDQRVPWRRPVARNAGPDDSVGTGKQRRVLTQGRHDGGQAVTYALVIRQKENAVVLRRMMVGVIACVAVVEMAAGLVGVQVVGHRTAQVDVDVVRLPFGKVVVQYRPKQGQCQRNQRDGGQQPPGRIRRPPVSGSALCHATIISVRERAR